MTIRTHRNLPTDQVPDFARVFVGDSLVVIQTDDWRPPRADGGRHGARRRRAQGRAGTVHRPRWSSGDDGTGSVESIDGDIKATVPLLGSRMERALEPAIRAAIRVEQREGTAWLAAR